MVLPTCQKIISDSWSEIPQSWCWRRGLRMWEQNLKGVSFGIVSNSSAKISRILMRYTAQNK